MSCVRFYPNVLRSFCACHTFLSECLAFDHACCLPPVRQTGRLAGCSVPVPPWVVIAISAFSGCRAGIELGWFTSGLCVSLWRSRRRTKGTGERGERSRRRGRVRFCVTISALRRFPRGVRWGLRAPDCAKEPLALWTLFIWVAAWVRFTRRRALGYNGDLTGLRSFCACHAFLSECLAFGSRLLFAACAPNRTACGMFRSCSAVGRDRH